MLRIGIRQLEAILSVRVILYIINCCFCTSYAMHTLHLVFPGYFDGTDDWEPVHGKESSLYNTLEKLVRSIALFSNNHCNTVNL